MLQYEFGTPIYLTTLFFILIAIFACAVACMATASRLIFSMSRDSILPKSKWLSFVDKNKSPSNSLLFIGVISTFFIILFEKIELITSVSAISGYIGYCGIIYSSFFLTGHNSKSAGFSIEDTAAMMSKLTDSGIEASIAGTSMRNILLAMQDPNSKLTKSFGKTIHSYDELVPAMNKFVEETKGLKLLKKLS